MCVTRSSCRLAMHKQHFATLEDTVSPKEIPIKTRSVRTAKHKDGHSGVHRLRSRHRLRHRARKACHGYVLGDSSFPWPEMEAPFTFWLSNNSFFEGKITCFSRVLGKNIFQRKMFFEGPAIIFNVFFTSLGLIISNHPPYIIPKPPTNTFLYYPPFIIPSTVLHHLYLDPGPNLGPGICGVQRPDGCAGLPPVPWPKPRVCMLFWGQQKRMAGWICWNQGAIWFLNWGFLISKFLNMKWFHQNLAWDIFRVQLCVSIGLYHGIHHH